MFECVYKTEIECVCKRREREGVCPRERKRTALTCIMIKKLSEKEREGGGINVLLFIYFSL